MSQAQSFRLVLFSSLLTASICPNLSAQELTLNGDFEFGDTGGWLDLTAVGQDFQAVNVSPKSGDWNGRLENPIPGTAAITKQANIGFGIVTPGQSITVSFWARGDAEIGGVHFAELFSELGGGGTSKSEILGGAPLFPASATEWQFYSFTTTLGPDVSGGLTLQFGAVTGADPGNYSLLEIDDVSVMPAVAIEGDYNGDGFVDAADYTVWRDNLGLDAAALNGNGSGGALVVPADYNLWKAQFGNPAIGSAIGGVGVPEPQSMGMLALALAAIATRVWVKEPLRNYSRN